MLPRLLLSFYLGAPTTVSQSRNSVLCLYDVFAVTCWNLYVLNARARKLFVLYEPALPCFSRHNILSAHETKREGFPTKRGVRDSEDAVVG